MECQEDIEQAREIFRKAGADDICVSREAAQVMYHSTAFQPLPASRQRLELRLRAGCSTHMGAKRIRPG